MKQLFIIFSLLSCTTLAYGQDNPDAYFDRNFKTYKPRAVNLPNTKISQQRWYFGLEAVFKVASSNLENSMNGLLSKSNNNNDVIWGANLGYNSNNKWAIELAYSPVPISTIWYVNSYYGPVGFEKDITLQSFPIRYKRNIFTLDKETQTTGVWVSGGIIISPNSHNETFALDTLAGGAINVVRGSDGKVISADIVRLVNASSLQNKSLVQFETGVELIGKIAEGFYINLFWRGVLGQNALIKNEFQNSVNSVITQTSNFTSNGFYYTFGLGFRYDFGKNIKYKSKLDD